MSRKVFTKMKTISISASTGNGVNKEFIGTEDHQFPETLDEAKAWLPSPSDRKTAFTEQEVLDMIRRSYVIDVQRTMRPKVTNEKAKQLSALEAAALTNPELAKAMVAQGITVRPTKENGLLNS